MLQNYKLNINNSNIFKYKNNENKNYFNGIKLNIKGQGVFSFKNPSLKPFKLHFNSNDEIVSLQINNEYSELSITQANIQTYCKVYKNIIIDKDINTTYWFSLISSSNTILFGTGEVRYCLNLIEEVLNIKWLKDVEHLYISNYLDFLKLYKEPIVCEPALKIKKTDLITIEDIATNNYTVPSNLNIINQKLFHNISGVSFNLNTNDFPNFIDVINESIKNPDGWCNKKLKEKSKVFGHNNPKETYLRITLGNNQGESPGVPYVIEIWPSGHYSPIHSHANANSIIRVLCGEINIELYSMLSQHHKKPFKVSNFYKDDITWISPRYNQTHRLCNKKISTCITVQSYLYEEIDNRHYEYFDYLDKENNIKQFTPNSDMDFVIFKNIMRKEYLKSKKNNIYK